MSSASEVVYYGIVDVVATPFFNFFLKDGASLHVQGSSIRKASIVFPVQLYASTILPSIERISSCALPSITLSAMKPPQPLDPSLPSYGIARCLSITCPKQIGGKAHTPFPRLHANQTMLSRIYSV